MTWLVISIAMSALVVLPPAVHAAIVRVHGTRVELECPAGFADATNFSGLQLADKRASIMVTEIPGPFTKVTAGFNPEGLATRGMKLNSKVELTAGAYPALLLSVSQDAFGTPFRKWIMVFGDNKQTVLVTGTFPVAEAESLSARIKAAVVSARLNANAASPDPLADLPFTISGTDSLKLAGRIQNGLVFTPSGKLDGHKHQPVFVVAQALSDVKIEDKAEFARQRIRQTVDFVHVAIMSEEDTRVAGLPAREILAMATNQAGQKVFVLQTIVYGLGSYFIMQGLADPAVREQQEANFRAIANSFKLKR